MKKRTGNDKSEKKNGSTSLPPIETLFRKPQKTKKTGRFSLKKKKKSQKKKVKNKIPFFASLENVQMFDSIDKVRNIRKEFKNSMKESMKTTKSWKEGTVSNSFLEKLSVKNRNYFLNVMKLSSELATPITPVSNLNDEIFSKSFSHSKMCCNSLHDYMDSSTVFQGLNEGCQKHDVKRSDVEVKETRKIRRSVRKKTKPFVSQVIKFFAEFPIWRSESSDEEFRKLFHPTNINSKNEIKNVLHSKKMFENSTINFFEKHINQTFICKSTFRLIQKEMTDKSSYLLLMELVVVKISNGWDYVKPKFINVKEKKVKSFCLKHGRILVREPSLFLKILLFCSFKMFENSVELLEVTIPYNDILFILSYFRKDRDKKLRKFIVEQKLKEYEKELQKNILLIKPIITLLLMDKKHRKTEFLENFLLKLSEKSIEIWSTIIWELIVQSEFFEIGAFLLDKFRNRKRVDFEELLINQTKFNKFVNEIQNSLEKSKEKRKKRIEILRKELRTKKDELFSGEFFLPFNNNIKIITGIIIDECILYKSNKLPIRLLFTTKDKTPFGGDDLRQDQFVMVMISFLDYILRKHNIDLGITKFQIIPTSSKTGLIGLIPNSFNFTEILENFSSLTEFLKVFNDTEEKYKEAVDRFSKSLAGYSLLTFLLLVGDRHFENLMMTTNGSFFHVDFSFIFGKDPKLKSSMRVTSEMIDVLGGFDTEYFYQFSVFLCTAYQQLRYHSNIIISLLYFMAETKIPQITKENIQKTISNFKLDLTDKEANVFLLTKMFKSLTSITPKINDFIHKMAQFLRE